MERARERATEGATWEDHLDQRMAEILSYVRDRGETSRGDIATHFGLDKKTVARTIDRLREARFLEPAGLQETAAGRPRELLKLNRNRANVIGVDLGATHITGILADLELGVKDRLYFEIRPGLPVELILQQMKTIAKTLRSSAKATGSVEAGGICVPGFVEPGSGVSVVAENIPGWRDVRLKKVFEEELGLPVKVDDCSRAFGRAERRLGAGRRLRDFVLADLGYGIGMSIMIGGQPYAGARFRAGEIGHTVIEPDGLPCACGNRGCLETVASGRAIARQAAEGITAGRSELLRDLVKGRAEEATAQDVSVAARMGDEFSLELLSRAGARIGIALANAVNILNPPAIVLGGGLVAGNRVLLDAVSSSLRQHGMPGLLDGVELICSGLGADGSVLGAAAAAVDMVLKEGEGRG